MSMKVMTRWMMVWVLSVCAWGLSIATAIAADPEADPEADPVAERLENSPRHHEWVDVAAGASRKVRAFVAYPEVDRPVTAVVVIHENRGLTDWVRSVADQLAEAGYVAIAPDLLSGRGPEGGGTDTFATSDAARQAIYQLDQAQVLKDLDATVAYVRALDASNDKVVVGGFCWGGGQSFRYAAHSDEIAAACVFYGSAPQEEATYAAIDVPVYGFYGENDRRITGQVQEVADRMKALGKVYEPVVYDGAGHGFMRAGEEADASDENKAARKDGWERWLKILGGV